MPSSPLMTKRQVAAYFQVSTRTIDEWCQRRYLTFMALPAGKRFRPEDIERFGNSRMFHRAEA